MSTPKSKKTKNEHKVKAPEVLEWVKKRGIFSTQQVADHFGIRLMQAAACIAILRIPSQFGKEVVRSMPKPERSEDQSSRWQYCG